MRQRENHAIKRMILMLLKLVSLLTESNRHIEKERVIGFEPTTFTLAT